MSFADITVVGITGTDSYTEGTMYAVARSCAELPGSRGLLISLSCPQDLPENIPTSALPAIRLFGIQSVCFVPTDVLHRNRLLFDCSK